MAGLRILGMTAAILFLITGCGPRPDPPRPAVVSHLDISQKKAFIDKTRSTLKTFHDTARDLRHRGDNRSRSELAGGAERYIETQVEPIVNDFEADNNLQTRIEVAELQLLCGMLYFELEKYWQAHLLLRDMERRYRDRPEVLHAALDPNEFGFRDIDDGIRSLGQRLYRVEQ